MTLIDKIIEETQKNHYQSDVWCKHCDSRWLFTVPYTIDATEEKEGLFRDLANNVCPKCNERMTDTIRFRTDLTKEFEDVCDRPWNYEPV